MITETLQFTQRHDELNLSLPTEWTIRHNLDEYGLKIEDALVNFSARTTQGPLSQEEFCKYVVSKDPVNLKCSPR